MDLKLLKKLNAGAEKISVNAVALYREAALLAENGAWSRALFLHQISMEECAKVEVLGASAANLLTGGKVDFKSVANVFRSHEKKNRVNAYFLEPSAKERRAQRSGLLEEAVTAFSVVEDRFHARSNTEKNAALYVDLQGEEFKAPAERITARMVARIGKLNERFLFMTAQKVELLQSCERHPEKYAKGLADMKRALKKALADNPKDPGKAMGEFLKGMMARIGNSKTEFCARSPR